MAVPPAVRGYNIKRDSSAAAVFFWIVQIIFGAPSLVLAAAMILSGKAEGALFSIALFLVWIGATLAVGVATLIHGESAAYLPLVFKVELPTPAVDLPDGFDQEFQGYPFRQAKNGTVEVLTAQGVKTYRTWKAFMQDIGSI
jgi:hypothetical protein